MSLFNRPVIIRKRNHFDDGDFLYDQDTGFTFIKTVSGVCPPNINSPGYIVICGMVHPAAQQTPHIWLLDENGYEDVADMLLDMSRVHAHYKVDTHYARFKRSKDDMRVYDDFLRHVQRFNLEAIGQKRAHITIQDAPWTNDRGHLKFYFEKIREELRIGNRSLYWHEPTPPSAMALNGVDQWELVKDDNTMLGALCYGVAGLLVDKPSFDRTGRIHTGVGTVEMGGKFNPTHTLDKFLKNRGK